MHAAASNLAVVEMGVNSDFAERYRRAATRVNEMCVFRPPPSQKVAYIRLCMGHLPFGRGHTVRYSISAQ